MDFSQLLCSGFQFLNLDDACEAEVDILQDMLFKQQDATQLSKLFHLKTFPEGESCYGKYFIEDHHHGLHHHPGGVVEEIGRGGLCDHQEEEEEDEQEAIQQQLHQQHEPPLPDVSSIQMANGPLVQISPQHQHQQQQQQQQQHVINVDQNPGECGVSGGGDLNNPPMLPSMPQPLRSYYSQQHVSVVHGSPGQGSPGMGQQHVSPAGYSHVQVPISMHQQQLIMMPAQPQAGQPFHSLGMPPSAVHFVAPQRQHHGHPPHNYVQGGPPQNKYNNGPRKSHSNRSRRGEQDAANMMNNYQAAAYYQGMYPQGIVPGIHHGYNLQQQFAHTVTGSPIIMQPAGHHKQAPVTMYATHQYSSPPPPQNNPVTPHTSPPENQQQHSPGLVEVQQQHHSNPPIPSPSSSHHHHQQHHQQQQLQQQHQQQIVPDNIEVNQAKDPSHEKQQQYPHEKQQHQQPEVHFEAKRSEVMTSPPAAASKKDPIESRQVIQEGVNDEVEIKSRSSPVPDKKQDNNKCSSPVTTSTTRTTTTASQKDSRQTVVAPQRTQTWADASAAKPTNRPNPLSSSSVPSSSAAAPPAAGVVSVETLKDSKNKSSEFPALGGKSNVNGTGSASVFATPMTVSSAPVVTSSIPTPTPTPAPPTPVQQQQQQQPSQKSWASVVCKNKTLSGNSLPSPAPSAAALAPANNNNGLNGSQQLPSASSSSSSFSSASAPASSVVSVGQDSSSNGSSDKKQNQGSGAAAGDNNGHVNVPIQSSSVVVDRAGGSGGGRASDHQLSFDSSHLSNESDPLAIRLGEFLANYSLNHQATALTPRGLTNQSNFCYINATLQALMACPPFVNLFRSMKEVGLAKIPCKATPIIQSVFDFVSEFEPLNRGNTNKRDRRNDSSFITGANLEPSGIRKVLGLLDGSTFKVEGRQQDAEEFLSHLLNGLHDEMIKVIQWYEKSKSNGSSSMGQQVVVVAGSGSGGGGGVVNGGHPEVGSEDDGDADNWQVMGSKNKASVTRKTNIVKSPISEMLFGQLCSALQRTNERNNVRNLQPFFTLQLDIQNDNIKSIRDALEGLSTKEEVSGLVSMSGQETTAWRQLSLEELPMILILHLKRFVYDKSGHKIQKLDKKLEFGIDLEIGKELLSVNTRSKWNQKQRTYKLFAVVYHDGEEAYKGHYIADCFHPSGGNIWGQVGWLRYDDITVKPIQDSAMLNSQPPRVPYLLYYRRADTLVSHHNNPQAPRNKDRPRNNNNSNSSNTSNFASSSES